MTDEPFDISGEGAEVLFKLFKDGPSDTGEFVVTREHIEEGKSFSVEALEAIRDQVFVFIGARVMAAWERRNEPPTMLRITVEVKAQ